MGAVSLKRSDVPDYDSIAGFYRKHWCSHYHSGLLAVVERYLITGLPPGARILDVCCGTGLIARRLAENGFRVTGLDASEQMLRCAAAEAPQAQFLIQDARVACLRPVFDGALCTFDSMSYFISSADLLRVCASVCAALKPGGGFLFDLSLEETYRSEWNQTCSVIEDDEACFIRGTYDEQHRIGRTLITRFELRDTWLRSDVRFETRCWSPEEVLSALHEAGFATAHCHRSDQDPELLAHLGPGRACFLAQKSLETL